MQNLTALAGGWGSIAVHVQWPWARWISSCSGETDLFIRPPVYRTRPTYVMDSSLLSSKRTDFNVNLTQIHLH